eukprot:COSAG02_NODE_30188_length_555_cov_2.046053_1_plen_44_part_10
MGKGADGGGAAAGKARAGNPLLEPGTVDKSWPKAGEDWIQGKEY